MSSVQEKGKQSAEGETENLVWKIRTSSAQRMWWPKIIKKTLRGINFLQYKGWRFEPFYQDIQGKGDWESWRTWGSLMYKFQSIYSSVQLLSLISKLSFYCKLLVCGEKLVIQIACQELCLSSRWIYNTRERVGNCMVSILFSCRPQMRKPLFPPDLFHGGNSVLLQWPFYLVHPSWSI